MVKFRKQLILKITNQEVQGKNNTVSVLDVTNNFRSIEWRLYNFNKKLFSPHWVQAEVDGETEACDENLDTAYLNFRGENLQSFVEVDAALWTSEKSNDEQIARSMLNRNEDKSLKVNDEAEDIIFKVPSVSKVFFLLLTCILYFGKQ